MNQQNVESVLQLAPIIATGQSFKESEIQGRLGDRKRHKASVEGSKNLKKLESENLLQAEHSQAQQKRDTIDKFMNLHQ